MFAFVGSNPGHQYCQSSHGQVSEAQESGLQEGFKRKSRALLATFSSYVCSDEQQLVFATLLKRLKIYYVMVTFLLNPLTYMPEEGEAMVRSQNVSAAGPLTFFVEEWSLHAASKK